MWDITAQRISIFLKNRIIHFAKDVSVKNQQHIRNMESKTAKLKQQNATLLTQQNQQRQQQLQL